MTAISDQAAQALYDACSHRGKHKGMLLAKCPRSTTLAAAAWQAAMLVCNPYQVPIAACLFMSSEQKTIFNEIQTALESLPLKTLVSLQRDRKTLESLGAW